MQFFNNLNYVYKVELLVILGIVAFVAYIFHELGVFHPKKK